MKNLILSTLALILSINVHAACNNKTLLARLQKSSDLQVSQYATLIFSAIMDELQGKCSQASAMNVNSFINKANCIAALYTKAGLENYSQTQTFREKLSQVHRVVENVIQSDLQGHRTSILGGIRCDQTYQVLKTNAELMTLINLIRK